MLKRILLILSFTMATSAGAQDITCEAKATEKKLAGAAKTSFEKKCNKDMMVAKAQTTCEATAGEKKLAGAAKTSFVKKCGQDAVATNAKTTCEASSAEKKLAGAAKASFEKKCLKDAVGLLAIGSSKHCHVGEVEVVAWPEEGANQASYLCVATGSQVRRA